MHQNVPGNNTSHNILINCVKKNIFVKPCTIFRYDRKHKEKDVMEILMLLKYYVLPNDIIGIILTIMYELNYDRIIYKIYKELFLYNHWKIKSYDNNMWAMGLGYHHIDATMFPKELWIHMLLDYKNMLTRNPSMLFRGNGKYEFSIAPELYHFMNNFVKFPEFVDDSEVEVTDDSEELFEDTKINTTNFNFVSVESNELHRVPSLSPIDIISDEEDIDFISDEEYIDKLYDSDGKEMSDEYYYNPNNLEYDSDGKEMSGEQNDNPYSEDGSLKIYDKEQCIFNNFYEFTYGDKIPKYIIKDFLDLLDLLDNARNRKN